MVLGRDLAKILENICLDLEILQSFFRVSSALQMMLAVLQKMWNNELHQMPKLKNKFEPDWHSF